MRAAASVSAQPRATDPRPRLGRTGEDAAARYLHSLGYRIRARNVRIGRAELDLVAVRGGGVVFCEVKTRRGAGMGVPEEAVTHAKQRRIVRAAEGWLARRRWTGQVRFDVISITVEAGGRLALRHLEDAFRP
ncbi:MAG TPA: YraN family protein [Gemmatimonadota bacterium]|jgi:putative endonuclease